MSERVSRAQNRVLRAGAGVVARKGDRATHFRSNGVAHTHLVNVERIKRQRVEQLEDRDGLSSWNPFEDDEGWEDVVGEVDSVTTLPEHTPRRRNASDDPMLQWIPHISSFLDDLLRRSSGASRRQFNLRQLRTTLHGLVPLRPMRPVSPMRELRLRAASRSASAYTAAKGGCRSQEPARHSVLDAFRLLKVVCNVNATDFMHALARTTNAAFKDRVPQRKSMGRMSRQYDFLLLLSALAAGT
ncbi:hypothetical protein HMN09_00725800 [Mycena chlorophos]|uniref:Uncharacterized protein n=1 Tax=Mycena chlorophos TaxID=658473 RepID=A0A8H6SXH6_MYCCL|nr:hypothetical protein HMN09_00725800 [Mycena chlorophos]